MDIYRLGRGENKDWILIKDTFLNSETVIVITPNKIYDLEIKNDGIIYFMSIFTRIESKTIKGRK